MTTIPDLNLASDPDTIVRMRTATVADSIDFSSVQTGMEESVTTLFLDRVQDKATYSNPKKWTGEDRRLMLFWYWLHTASDTKIALEFTCSVCGEKHIELVDMSLLADGYKPIKGKPERDILDGNVYVHPLLGVDLEKIESMRLALEAVMERDGIDSSEANKLNAKLHLYQILLSISFADEKGQKDPEGFREKKILSMDHIEFSKLAEEVAKATDDMEHGLESEYDNGRIFLLTPPVKCKKPENAKEDGTRLRLPFRNYDYIPRL